ncbi:MAG: tRNA pseudouridine(55) synthase TruB [Lentisphaeraceae bacterium]|nr:tRNA pseudouridine(55) synthase TruB [Lentisphaeraceae bacterium]
MKLSQEKIADPASGLLLVNKPKEWTSHDVVNFARRRFNFKKVGHCGTLDPNATGLLILVVGHATKASEMLAGEDKTYTTVMTLGKETSSHDGEGDVVKESPWDHITEEQVTEVLNSFVGPQQQIPPMVSAVKKGGKKLYELARKGIEIEREPRPITIHSISIGKINLPEVEFTVRCSKGTYIRTLCHDIGIKLGSSAYMSELVRTESGGFSLENSFEIEDMKTWERDTFLDNMIQLRDFIMERTLQQ